MRATDTSMLQSLITAAGNWRTTVETNGGELTSITATLSGGEGVRLDWVTQTQAQVQADGTTQNVVVYSGWEVTTLP